MDRQKFIKRKPATDPVDMYAKLTDREATQWKMDEEKKKEFYRFKQEQEQMMCSVAAGMYSEIRKSLQ